MGIPRARTGDQSKGEVWSGFTPGVRKLWALDARWGVYPVLCVLSTPEAGKIQLHPLAAAKSIDFSAPRLYRVIVVTSW